MPLYYLVCEVCGTASRRILTPAQAKIPPDCACGGVQRRNPRPPTANVVETLDNGFMARRVERPADAERLYRERSRTDPLKDK